MMFPAKTYQMNLEVDIRQVSTAIRYNITENNISVLQDYGQRAGSYLLEANSLVNVIVTVYYAADFEIQGDPITNVTLVSLPGASPKQHILSPFDVDTAGIVLRGWRVLEHGATANVADTQQLVMATAPLLVVGLDGQWQLSCYLSVRAVNVEADKTITRVFSFDPSVVVGGGGDPH